MAQVDGKVDLVWLRDLEHALVLVHVNSNEFVADFRSVLGGVDQTKLLSASGFSKVRRIVDGNLITFDALLPADLVEAFPEEDNVGKHCLVEHLIDARGCAVQIKGEDLVHQHLSTIMLREVVVVVLPYVSLGLLGVTFLGFSSLFSSLSRGLVFLGGFLLGLLVLIFLFFRSSILFLWLWLSLGISLRLFRLLLFRGVALLLIVLVDRGLSWLLWLGVDELELLVERVVLDVTVLALQEDIK